MPLPGNDLDWPPPDIRAHYRRQEAWAAWWSGDEDQLRLTSGHHAEAPGRRRFWQRRATGDTTKAHRALHAPLAADIAQVSADLLFGEPPRLTMPEDAPEGTQKRLDEITDVIGLGNRLLEGAEIDSAIGGVYLRPVWDRDVFDRPLATVIGADRALPRFRHGVLVEVAFHEKLDDPAGEQGAQVWRHLENHRPGVIEHGLYVGTSTNLGRSRPLTDHPATADLDDAVTDHAQVTDGLLVSYVPNVLPNRIDPSSSLGRSDFAGAEGFLDSLDETWTSWMRDIRAGQARILADTSVLTPPSVGAGASAGRFFDPDEELFSAVNMAEREEPIEQVQFDIRVQEHEQSALALTEQIVSAAGYSPQTFGIKIEGRAESGTALRLREAKTFRTQGRKQRYWKPGVEHTAEMLLGLDRVIFGRGTPQARPTLTFPELVDDPAGRASWVNTLGQAMAASVRTRVKLAQPELEEPELTEEVDRVLDETGMRLPQPNAQEETP